MNSEVIRIRIETVIEIARNRSSTIEGSGRISTTRMVRTPNARARSPRLRISPISPRLGEPLLVLGACPAGVGGATFGGAAPRPRRDGDHGSSSPPRLAATAAERIGDGRRAAGPKVRY